MTYNVCVFQKSERERERGEGGMRQIRGGGKKA